MRTFDMNVITTALDEATGIMFGLFGNFVPVKFQQIKIGHSTTKWASVTNFGNIKWDLYVSDVFAQIDDAKAFHDRLVGTLVHELIHTMLPAGEGHGKKFKAAAAVVNKHYPWCQVQRCTSMADYGIKHNYRNRASQRTVRYMVRCEDCGQLYRYASKRRWMTPALIKQCSCGKCKSHNLSYKHVTPAEVAELNKRG